MGERREGPIPANEGSSGNERLRAQFPNGGSLLLSPPGSLVFSGRRYLAIIVLPSIAEASNGNFHELRDIHIAVNVSCNAFYWLQVFCNKSNHGEIC